MFLDGITRTIHQLTSVIQFGIYSSTIVDTYVFVFFDKKMAHLIMPQHYR